MPSIADLTIAVLPGTGKTGRRIAQRLRDADVAVPGTDRAVGRFAALAAEAGLARLVLLVGRGQRNAEAAETAARVAFPDATVLHASWFIQEFSEGSLHDMILDGVVALPVGDVPEPFVDVDDVADVAVAALTADGHTGCSYEITGPEPLTFAEATAVAGAAAGRSVRLEAVGLVEHLP